MTDLLPPTVAWLTQDGLECCTASDKEAWLQQYNMQRIAAEHSTPLCALSAIAPLRAKLAEQCGKTLAAQAQRDELRGLLLEADGELNDYVDHMERRGAEMERTQDLRKRIRAALSRCAT